ncbi:MAG TPA: two-component sensor histidine kinase [Clostridium sp.]|nr:two-component sensor histidine kinase [Clostridium sp.]
MKKFTNSIRVKFTLIFISILCFACVTSLSFVLIATPNLSEIVSMSDEKGIIILLILTVLLCAVIGSILMVFATKFISKPIKHISDVTKEVAKGNFDVRIQYKSDDEIGILAENFNLMTEELKNIEYLRRDFINNVSHEFKTPISSIKGFVELIKDKNLPEEKFDEYTDIIIEETNRLSNLSSNLLRISALENKTIQSKGKNFSLDEQIRKSILLFEEQWIKKNLELDINLESVNYEGDEELVQQIWINLIGNAIKFSHNDGTVHISMKQDDKNIIVEVRDEGIGISEKDKSRIFDIFNIFRNTQTKSFNVFSLFIG